MLNFCTFVSLFARYFTRQGIFFWTNPHVHPPFFIFNIVLYLILCVSRRLCFYFLLHIALPFCLFCHTLSLSYFYVTIFFLSHHSCHLFVVMRPASCFKLTQLLHLLVIQLHLSERFMSDIVTTFVALWLFVTVLPPLLLSHNQHRAPICHTCHHLLAVCISCTDNVSKFVTLCQFVTPLSLFCCRNYHYSAAILCLH